MKLLGPTKSKITKNGKGENMLQLEIVKLILVNDNIVNMN